MEISLAMADASPSGRADPMYEAHAAPIGLWAEAVWNQWLPRGALQALISAAVAKLTESAKIWCKVAGPAAAYVASAWRLGWKGASWCEVTDDAGKLLQFCRDAPRRTRDLVYKSARRWRNRRIYSKFTGLPEDRRGDGLFLTPIYRLLNAKPNPSWTREDQGGLRSVYCGRQWPQVRLVKAGLAKTTSFNCCLCVA